jgi:uncharacterized protein YkwD
MKQSKTLLSIFLAFIMAATAVCASISANAANIVSVKITGIYGQTEARSMLATINNFRTGSDAWYWNEDDKTKTVCKDLKPLAYDYGLEKIAMQRAAEISICLSHTRPDGNRWTTALDEAGRAATYKGENIAAWQVSAEEAFTSWREEDEPYATQGHRRNMLSANYTAIGIAMFNYEGKNYWVQTLASPTTDTTVTTANDNETTVAMNVDSSKLAEYGVDKLPTEAAITYATTAPAPAAVSTTAAPATTTKKAAQTTTKAKAKKVKITLKKVTVKKKASKLVLQATVKVNGKPVKSKKVTFKFNGKKYTAKTNKKGVAKVTIKKSVLKKLKKGKKVTYSATYSKNTVKRTVKVK